MAMLLSDGFESGNYSAWTTTENFGCLGAGGSMAVNSNLVLNGSFSSEHYYKIGTGCAAHQDQNRFFRHDLVSSSATVFFRGNIRFKTPEPGGTVNGVQRKLFRYMQARDNPTWWTGLTSDSSSGTIPLRAYKNSSDNDPVSTSFWNLYTLNYDQWYLIEFYVSANTPGLSDGTMTLWVDGVKRWERLAENLRGSKTSGIKVVLIGEQSDRTNTNVIDEKRYWDNVEIWNTNPLADESSPIPPAHGLRGRGHKLR